MYIRKSIYIIDCVSLSLPLSLHIYIHTYIYNRLKNKKADKVDPGHPPPSLGQCAGVGMSSFPMPRWTYDSGLASLITLEAGTSCKRASKASGEAQHCQGQATPWRGWSPDR